MGSLTDSFRYRVYCANVTCGTFLNPAGHVTDSQANITFAICESDNCGKVTCVTCKALVEDGIEDHICEVQEDERRFKEAVHEQGYKECFVCGRTVELTEACNHITCECGHNFCYVCGKDWSGMHGCPQYGPANYDEEGYNQDGFHRNTELNRAGLTRLEQRLQDRGEDGDDNHDSDNEDQDREEDMPDWDVLQHLSPGNRAIINALPHTHRQDALEMIRIELMEEQGITFNEPQHGDHEANVQDNADDNSDEDNDDNSDDENQENEVSEGTNQEQGEEGEVDAEDHPESADHEHENNDLYGSDNPVGQAGEVSVEPTSSRGVEPFEHDAEHAPSGDVAVNDPKGEHMNDETTVLGEHSASPTSHQRETERGNYLIDLSDAGYENDTQVSSFGDNIIALLGVEFGNG
jgi:hypothetical protein